MLKPEIARERLKEFQTPNLDAQLAAAVRPLSEAQRTACYGLLGRDAQGKAFFGGDYAARQKALDKAMAPLLGPDGADRRAVLGALFGPLAPHVEAGWRLHDRLPYQSGWMRKPFRAPQHPRRADAARVAWLQSLLHTARPYQDQTLPWLAAWASYVGGYQADALGVLLAAAIDQRDAVGEEVFDILLATARGEHEIGAMGRHVTRALLAADRPDGWEFVEKLLLAAQRQEGLRQTILESVDQAHPEAFRRMLRVIRENDLTRFSATIRAVDVWFGFGWDAMNARFAAKALEQVEMFLDSPQARAGAMAGGDPQTAYLALLGGGIPGRPGGNRPGTAFAFGCRPGPPVRRGPPAAANDAARSERRPRARAGRPRSARRPARPARRLSGRRVRALERLTARMPTKPKTLDALVWEWTAQVADRSAVADYLPRRLGKRSPIA